VLLPLYRAERKGKGRGGGGVGARRWAAAINGDGLGGVAWWGGFGEGKGEEAARVGGGALRGRGGGRGGRTAPRQCDPRGHGRERRPEVGDDLTGGPHLSVAAWERGREAGVGGPAWAERWLGRRV
jgi:hypothetical protein